MRRTLAILICCFFLPTPTQAYDPVMPDGVRASDLGGLIISRQGNQTIITLGGALFNRKAWVVSKTDEGRVVTRFTLPSAFHTPYPVWVPEAAPAMIRVEIPDPDGLIYIDGEMIRTEGKSRQFESPRLPPGQQFPLHVRAAFKVGDNLLIEDKQVVIRAGDSIGVTFDGSGAVSVPLPPNKVEKIPVPPDKK